MCQSRQISIKRRLGNPQGELKPLLYPTVPLPLLLFLFV